MEYTILRETIIVWTALLGTKTVSAFISFKCTSSLSFFRINTDERENTMQLLGD